MSDLTKNFPFSKEDLGNLCVTVELLILNVSKNASKSNSPIQVMQILKGYQSLKYPLLAIWESYGFGNISEISSGLTSPEYYQAFKIDAIDTLQTLINGISNQNPFDFYGKINNSDKVVEKLVTAYRHLLDNLQSGRLVL